MRKSDIRKWVHGILDLLPLLVIPVFMVYSHRHTIDSNSVTIAENEIVNFNQLFTTEYVYDTHTTLGVTVTKIENGINLDGNFTGSGTEYNFFTGVNSLNNTHIYYFRGVDLDTVQLTLNIVDTRGTVYTSTPYRGANINTFRCYKQLNVGSSFDNLNIRLNIFDLTLMFGSGNEPSIEDFDNYFPNTNYSYNTGTKKLLKGISTVTYNDTDIGSQFVYSLYNVTNNYFNFNNVFGFGNLQDWFLLNIFGGNAPLSFYIVWQVVLYEFLMDLIFLIYGLFMWFIDMCEKLMNKPLNAIK